MKSNILIENREISFEYIRGLVEGEGCFTFCKSTRIRGGIKIIELIPTFALGMSKQDENLMHIISNKLGLKNNVLIFRKAYRKDGYNRQQTVRITVRHPKELRDIIIPLFNKKLI